MCTLVMKTTKKLKVSIKSVNGDSQTKEGAKNNIWNVGDYADVWYIDENNNLQLFER